MKKTILLLLFFAYSFHAFGQLGLGNALLKAKSQLKKSSQPKYGQSPPCMELAQNLLDRRDEYISKRINETLLNGEMGLLFLGLNHRIEGKLPSDITLIQPLGELTQNK